MLKFQIFFQAFFKRNHINNINIKEVILFPAMKPVDEEKDKEKEKNTDKKE